MNENRRPVLCPEVRSLPVHLRRIVHVPECFHQRLVTHLLRIKRHLHHFRVPRRIGADFLVRRIFRLPSAVSHQRVLNPRNHPELCLHSPKASRRKRRQFTHLLVSLFLILTLSKPFVAAPSFFPILVSVNSVPLSSVTSCVRFSSLDFCIPQ